MIFALEFLESSWWSKILWLLNKGLGQIISIYFLCLITCGLFVSTADFRGTQCLKIWKANYIIFKSCNSEYWKSVYRLSIRKTVKKPPYCCGSMADRIDPHCTAPCLNTDLSSWQSLSPTLVSGLPFSSFSMAGRTDNTSVGHETMTSLPSPFVNWFRIPQHLSLSPCVWFTDRTYVVVYLGNIGTK